MELWRSEKLYEHPATHRRGVYGNVVLSTAGVYALQTGGCIISCPQRWAAKIHYNEISRDEDMRYFGDAT